MCTGSVRPSTTGLLAGCQGSVVFPSDGLRPAQVKESLGGGADCALVVPLHVLRVAVGSYPRTQGRIHRGERDVCGTRVVIRRGPTCACLRRESLREPDAGNLHVRFDEGRGASLATSPTLPPPAFVSKMGKSPDGTKVPFGSAHMPKNRHIRAIAGFYHAAKITWDKPTSKNVGFRRWEKATIDHRMIESATG
jgi:hypothetical protein